MTDHMGGNAQGPGDPQSRYYDRYLHDESRNGGGPGKGSNKGLIIGIGALIAALIIAGTVYAVTSGGDEPQQAQTTTGPTTTAQSSTERTTTSESSSTSSSSSTTDPAAAYGPATQPGWKTIVGKEGTDDAAFDVPSTGDWNSAKLGYVGWTPDNPDDKSVIARYVARFGEGNCPTLSNDQQGFVGFIDIGSRDLVDAAEAVVNNAANNIAIKKDKKTYAARGTASTKQITVGPGKITAVQSELTATVGDPDSKKCDPEKVDVRAVAFTSNGHSALLFLARNAGKNTKKALPNDIWDKITQSVRIKK
ncbi:hypothetical protein G9U51_06120 [Calidifontibacter sp. DB0510]|uniref:DUF8017 domain-containing protein n=1 Tax=Metallococcus carri TaxID=1656884 RepID=A0A967B153_9MICO|nr:hypothetical protein [Metallococcus carri]NHN55360.1 hypothetical protein [Metallococcus carri]NOP36437.1 hypothetical protein [Calidifontibacter sp. DB2511S]